MESLSSATNVIEDAPASSARGENFLSCLPLDMLEREIFPQLSPPEVASLILSVGINVSPAARPIIYIRWKHLSGGRKNENLTLTVNSRNDERILRDITPSIRPANPADGVYLSSVGLIPLLQLQNITDAVVWLATAKYATHRAVTTRSYLLILGALIVGLPLKNLANINPREIMKSPWHFLIMVPEVSLLEHLYQCASEYSEDTKTSTISREEAQEIVRVRYERDHIRSCGAIDILLREGIIVQPISWTWKAVSEEVYCHALSSGYIWLVVTGTADAKIFNEISDARWDMFVEDATRRAAKEPARVQDIHFNCFQGLAFERRLPQVIEICGAQHRLITVYPVSVWKATTYRKLLGDEQFKALALKHCLAEYIASGAEYSPVDTDARNQRNIVEACIKFDNARFLRGFLDDPNFKFAGTGYNYYRQCFSLGRVECLTVLLDRGFQLSPHVLDKLLSKCHSRDIVRIFS
jgi:hypothetical protein